MTRWSFVALSLALAACSESKTEKQVEAAPKPEPIAVQLGKAETRRVDRTLSATGELMADESVSVAFEVAGRVTKIHTDFGRQVRKGDVIAELDPREYQIQLERAQAMLTQALARMGLDADQPGSSATTSPAIRQAEAQLADARSKFESAEKLYKTGDIAQERFFELEKSMAARKAAVDAASNDLRTLAASALSLRADVKLVEKRLTDTVVRAPFDGAVTERMVSPGQYLKENTPVVRLVKADPLRLRAEIPEAATAGVRPGSTLTFTTAAAPGETFNATVQRLNPSLDQKSRTMTAEAIIRNPKAALRPGTFVQVQVVTQRDVPIITVPRRALYSIAGLTKMFAIRDGKAVEYRVPPGTEGEGWMEVPPDSVKAGETVAVSNLAALIDQSPVVAR